MRPIIACFPPLWRLLQSVRRYYDSKNKLHLWGALKYSVNFWIIMFSAIAGVNVTSPAFSLWVIASTVSSIYTYYWDVTKDWGILNLKNVREEMMFPKWVFFHFFKKDLFGSLTLQLFFFSFIYSIL